MEVVITRDEEEGAPYAAALGAGWRPVYLPLTQVAGADPADLDRLRAALRTPRDHLFVASRHAVPPLAAAVRAAGLAPAEVAPATAVGPATAAALTAAGFTATARGDTGVDAAAALVAAVRRAGAGPGWRVLAPRAAAGRDEPLALLRAAGAEVEDLVAYRTVVAVPGSPALAAGRAALAAGAALCLVFAPSQVEALAALLAADGGLAACAARFVAIGPTTAAALRAHGVACATAAAPTPEAMANAVATVYPEA